VLSPSQGQGPDGAGAGKQPRPLVSVIIPAYDGERFIAEALDSALGQSWEPVEVIVVDDGSSDRTAEIAGAYPEVQLIRQANAGPAAARNTGIRAASGELICRLDQDDLMPADRLETQAGYLLSHPEVGGVLGREELLVEPGIEPPLWARAQRLPRPGQPGGEPNRDPIYPPSTLVARRWAFERIGLFSEQVHWSDDVDWVFRARDRGLRIATVDQVVLIHRLHGGNLTYDTATQMSGLARALKGRIDRHRRGEVSGAGDQAAHAGEPAPEGAPDAAQPDAEDLRP
jgi:glycosyltransferase involved in cell wall biosynthesis